MILPPHANRILALVFAIILLVNTYTYIQPPVTVDARYYQQGIKSEYSERESQYRKFQLERANNETQPDNAYLGTEEVAEINTNLERDKVRLLKTLEQASSNENNSQEIVPRAKIQLPTEKMLSSPVVVGGQTNDTTQSQSQRLFGNGTFDSTPKFMSVPSSSVYSSPQGDFSIQAKNLDTEITSAFDYVYQPMTSGGSTFGDRITIDFKAVGNTSAVEFECTYDNHPSFVCNPAISISGVSLDDYARSTQHTLKISTKDSSGFVDPTPAVFTWNRLRVGSIPGSIDGSLDISFDWKRVDRPGKGHQFFSGDLHWNRTGQFTPEGTWQVACENSNQIIVPFPFEGPISTFLRKSTDTVSTLPYMKPWLWPYTIDYYGYVFTGSDETQPYFVPTFNAAVTRGVVSGVQVIGTCNIGWINNIDNVLVSNPLQPVKISQDGSIASTGTSHLDVSGNLGGPYDLDWQWELYMNPDPMPDTAITAMYDGNGKPILPGGTTTSGVFMAYFEGVIDYANRFHWECSLDNLPFHNCADLAQEPLGQGTHTFKVRIVDGAGYKDTSPATFKWNVKPCPRGSVGDENGNCSPIAVAVARIDDDDDEEDDGDATDDVYVLLDGSKSHDPDPGDTIKEYIWTQTDNTGIKVDVRGINKDPVRYFVQPEVEEETTLTFMLTVLDNHATPSQNQAEVSVTIHPCSKAQIEKTSKIEQDMRRAIGLLRNLGFQVGAETLELWLTGKGAELYSKEAPRPLNLGWVRSSFEVQYMEQQIHKLFEGPHTKASRIPGHLYGFIDALPNDGKMYQFSDVWKASVPGVRVTDYSIAVGGSQIEGIGEFQVRKGARVPNGVTIEGTVKYTLLDIFDWNRDTTFPIIRFGLPFLSAEDFNLLEKCGDAAPFWSGVKWQQSVSGLGRDSPDQPPLVRYLWYNTRQI